MRRLVVHIGLHKTGSTSIQGCLIANEAQLLKKGVRYLQSGRPSNQQIRFGQHLIPWDFMGRKEGAGAVEAMKTELETATQKTVVVSSEEFDKLDRVQIDRFVSVVRDAGYEVEVVFFFRHQVEILEGIYGTDICFNGVTDSIQNYSKTLSIELDYSRLVEKWRAASADLVIRPIYYNYVSFKKESIFQTFIKLGLQKKILGLVEVGRLNESLRREHALCVQHFWRLGIQSQIIYNHVIPALRKIPSQSSARFGFLSPSESIEFQKNFDESNRKFLDAFPQAAVLIEPIKLTSEEDWAAVSKGSFWAVNQTLIDVSKFILSES